MNSIAFIRTSNGFAVSWFPDVCALVRVFSKEKMFKLLRSTNITTDKGPDDQSSLLLKYGAASVTDASNPLLNTS